MKLLQPTLIAAQLAALLAWTGAASAQSHSEITGQPSCQQLRPSDPPCPVPQAVAPASYAGDLSERTHAMILPTGNLLRQGEAQVQLNELGLYDRFAYGLTDQVELSVAMLIPFAVSAGLKVAVIEPTGPFRLVVGATVWKGSFGFADTGSVLQGSVTAAYQGERINVHASATAAQSLDDNDGMIAGYSLGVLARLSPRLAVSAELIQLGTEFSQDCCHEGIVAGIKLMGSNWDFDLGVATALEQSEASGMLPIIAASTRL